MSKDFSRGAATRAIVYTGSWVKGYLMPASSGTVTGVTSGGDTITAFPVFAGIMPQIEWGSISSAPANSLVIW